MELWEHVQYSVVGSLQRKSIGKVGECLCRSARGNGTKTPGRKYHLIISFTGAGAPFVKMSDRY
jgi:hypothetical protein